MRPPFPGPAALCLLLLLGCGSRDPARAANPAVSPETGHCLPGGAGYLRAQLRGAVNADIDWHDAQMSCDGSARPDGSGLRISIAGPLPAEGDAPPRRLRFVFGIDAASPGAPEQALPTNLTAIIEGEQLLYATRGDDKCTTDQLHRAPPAKGETAPVRIEARGFCTGPASALDGGSRLLVTTFDFAARLNVEAGQ